MSVLWNLSVPFNKWIQKSVRQRIEGILESRELMMGKRSNNRNKWNRNWRTRHPQIRKKCMCSATVRAEETLYSDNDEFRTVRYTDSSDFRIILALRNDIAFWWFKRYHVVVWKTAEDWEATHMVFCFLFILSVKWWLLIQSKKRCIKMHLKIFERLFFIKTSWRSCYFGICQNLIQFWIFAKVNIKM